MPDLLALFDGGDGPPPAGHAGTIVDVLADGRVLVVLGAFGDAHTWGPCPAMPRGALAPEVGGACLVVFDDDGQPWVPAWQP